MRLLSVLGLLLCACAHAQHTGHRLGLIRRPIARAIQHVSSGVQGDRWRVVPFQAPLERV